MGAHPRVRLPLSRGVTLRRVSVGVGVLLALTLGAFSFVRTRPSPVSPATTQNVLLIVVDTLRADAVGQGHTPRLDRFARGSRTFTRATSQAPWTTASIGSLMTSRYPTALGIDTERSRLPSEVPTLAEMLRTFGLSTGAVVSHSYCAEDYGFDRGFVQFDSSQIFGHLGISSPGVTERALAFLDAHQHEPFFLWVHLFDPHFAYMLHDGYDPEPTSSYAGPVSSGLRFAELANVDLAPPDVAQLRRLYASEVAFTDAHIGRLLDRLDALRLSPSTLVIIAADHGEEFTEHGRLGHSKTVYQELVHVPLLVRCPGWTPARIGTPVANLDIVPTVLACLGKPPAPGAVGRPLGPDLSATRPVFTMTAKRNQLVASIDGDDKLIAHPSGEMEWYDLRADPRERHDRVRAGEDPPARLVAALQAFRDQLAAEARPAEAVQIDAEERARLEALGYLE